MFLVIMPRKYKNKGIAASVDFKQIWEAIKLLTCDYYMSIRLTTDSFNLVPSTLLRSMKTFDAHFLPDELSCDTIDEDEALSFLESTVILKGKPVIF